MIAMQYKIVLPNDYDMKRIYQRVADNGNKTDGFRDLLFKAYLVANKENTHHCQNEYSPLYVWKSNEGMNTFIFNGFYNNILQSFGWQTIHIYVVLHCHLEPDFNTSKYVLAYERKINPASSMKAPAFSYTPKDCTGKVLVYSPETWSYVEYYFFFVLPKICSDGRLYDLLHLSL